MSCIAKFTNSFILVAHLILDMDKILQLLLQGDVITQQCLSAAQLNQSWT